MLAALALLLAVPAAAQQQGTVISISDPRGGAADLLRGGQQLEQQRRWGEALAHYEEAIRQYPDDAALHQRFDVARLHYDLERRYADRSFCESVLRLSAERALELYGQVLLKIESHYVELPQWKDLVERGSSNLEVALGELVFANRNIPERDRAAVDAFRRELWSVVSSRPVRSRADARETVAIVARLAQERLEVAPAAVVLEYLCGATNALDPYSTYLTPDQLNEQYSQIDGNYVGLGVELKTEQGGLVILRVIPGSPAEEAGVLAKDRILAIDRQPTKDVTTDQAANLLQGVDGSTVTLTLAAPEQPARQVLVHRRRVEVPSVDQVSMVDPQYGVGYFRLTAFQKTTPRDLDAALWKLHREGMKSLVIDVRGNPGGELLAAVDVADRFIERRDNRFHPRTQHPRGPHLLGPRTTGEVAVAAGGDHRPGQCQRGGDFCRGHPRPSPRHDRRHAELRQGLGANDHSLGRIQRRRETDHGQVLFAQRAAGQRGGRHAGRCRAAGADGGQADRRQASRRRGCDVDCRLANRPRSHADAPGPLRIVGGKWHSSRPFETAANPLDEQSLVANQLVRHCHAEISVGATVALSLQGWQYNATPTLVRNRLLAKPALAPNPTFCVCQTKRRRRLWAWLSSPAGAVRTRTLATPSGDADRARSATRPRHSGRYGPCRWSG